MAKYIPDFRAGDDYILKLTITDLNEVPVDITGNSYTLTLKSDFSDATPILQSTTVVGDNTSDEPINGIVVIHVSNTITNSLTSGRYYYEIEETANGVITTRVPPIEYYKDKVFVAPQLNVAI